MVRSKSSFKSGWRGIGAAGAAATLIAVAIAGPVTGSPLTSAPQPTAADSAQTHRVPTSSKPRTVVTTDMEQDDLASLVRYLYYTNDLDTEGIIYSASEWHWAGDGLGTVFTGSHGGPRTSLRWVGSNIIEDRVIPAYAKIYPNLVKADRGYPSPERLLDVVKLGNTDFEGEMDHDTAGSNLIKKLLLDSDRRPLYLQAWGGPNTIARALKSIQDQYSGSAQWSRIQAAVSAKAVILASGLQDNTYSNYIAVQWPRVKVEQLAAGYATWGYNCNAGSGNTRGLPSDGKYFQGDWIKANIQIGPLGSLYRSWLDGQVMPGDPADVFGDPVKAAGGWCKPLEKYDFLSEGDNVAFLPLLKTGIQAPSDPSLGGWGGRSTQTSTSPNLWTMVRSELGSDGTEVANYSTSRWQVAVQNDFANRVAWGQGLTAPNHAPTVRSTQSRSPVKVRPGQSLTLRTVVGDPDGDSVSLKWWQYREEGTYPGAVGVKSPTSSSTRVSVPKDAKKGQTLSFILQVTDSGTFPLTRYARVILEVK